jgi:hypothetical protein
MRRRWTWSCAAAGLFLMCWLLAWCSASAEPAPEVPVLPYSSSLRPVIAVAPIRVPRAGQDRPHLLDTVLYASIAGYRTLDYFSTRHALAGGAHERILPQWVVNNDGVFIAFEGFATAGEVSSSVWMIRHRHRRMARMMNAVSIGLGVQAVVNNYTEPLSRTR